MPEVSKPGSASHVPQEMLAAANVPSEAAADGNELCFAQGQA